MLDWPEHRHTSPTRMSESVWAAPDEARASSVNGPPAPSAGSSADQRPEASARALACCPLSETLTVSPAAALPHTAIGRSRCRTAWSWKMEASRSAAVASRPCLGATGSRRGAALERRGVLDVARPLVVRVRRVGAQRPAASGPAAARGPDGLRRLLVLDPVDDRAQHVEGVERRRSAATVAHPRHQEEPTPAGDHGRTTVRPGHPLVVVDRVEGREPRVADAVEEEELPAAAREGVEVRPARGRRQLHLRLGGRVLGPLVHVHLGRRERRAHGVRAAGEQPRYALGGGDARVEREARVHLPPLRVLRAGERPGKGLDLRLREAAVRLRPRATQRGGIESAPDRIGDDAVAQAVGGVAGGEQAVDDRLPIGVRERATAVRLSRRVERRHTVQHRRDPLVSDAGEGSCASPARRRRCRRSRWDSAAPSACPRARRSSSP